MKKTKYQTETFFREDKDILYQSEDSFTPTKIINKKDDEIIIYSSPFCIYCTRLKNKLEEEGLLHKVKIIEDNDMIPFEIKKEGFPYTVKNKIKFLGYPQSFENYKKTFF